MTTIRLTTPYLIFLGDVTDALNAKTGLGIAHWAPERCAGQMTLPGCSVDSGLPDLNVAAALSAGVRTVIIGVAPTGGQLEPNWLPSLLELARAGVDIASGLHSKLNENRDLRDAAQSGGANLVDVRIPPTGLACGLGRKRTGRRVLTVGTDCAVGKKYTALALHRDFCSRNVKATFRATGQTGIMIAGEGIPIDAVVADFIAGAAEQLSPDNDEDHWDVIEGQGSLLHPAYSGVTLGLMHGSQPDALVVCHDVGRDVVADVEGHFPIPPLDEFIEMALAAALLTSPACVCAGISINTSVLTDDERGTTLETLRRQHDVPVVDPVATGTMPIADFLLGSCS